MNPKTAHNLQRELNSLVRELDEICTDEHAREYYDDDYIHEQLDRWRSRATSWLRENLGSAFAIEFSAKRTSSFGDPRGSIDDRAILWRNHLLSLEEDIGRHPDIYLEKHAQARADGNESASHEPSAAIIERILVRFHAAAIQLRHRHDERNTLDVRDEYDAQDLLHVLLRAHFDDVRAEDVSPSYAGGSSRIDFVLPEHRIAVEVKVTSSRLKDKAVGEQLIIDIARYRNHPDCDKLMCFIYDPDHHLANPAGLVRDLSRKQNGLDVKVVVSPAA